jgi:hypothetical protein
VLGQLVSEKVVLRPRGGTFYAVDVLNPDVVRYRGRFLLFFSGNSAETNAGEWHTGVAVATSPEGPYSVDRRLRARFYNGGTAVVNGRLVHAANVPGRREPVLYTSVSGRRWREVSAMPAPETPGWRFWQSDLYLYSRGAGVDAYFAGRPGPSGADLGQVHYEKGRWGKFTRTLQRDGQGWDAEDLGEPAVFQTGERRYMLYGAFTFPGDRRHIGLARLTRTGWVRCGNRPFIAAGGQYSRVKAIDPEPLVVGNRLYVYFGGGQRSSLGGNMGGMILLRTYRLS